MDRTHCEAQPLVRECDRTSRTGQPRTNYPFTGLKKKGLLFSKSWSAATKRVMATQWWYIYHPF